MKRCPICRREVVSTQKLGPTETRFRPCGHGVILAESPVGVDDLERWIRSTVRS